MSETMPLNASVSSDVEQTGPWEVCPCQTNSNIFLAGHAFYSFPLYPYSYCERTGVGNEELMLLLLLLRVGNIQWLKCNKTKGKAVSHL